MVLVVDGFDVLIVDDDVIYVVNRGVDVDDVIFDLMLIRVLMMLPVRFWM